MRIARIVAGEGGEEGIGAALLPAIAEAAEFGVKLTLNPHPLINQTPKGAPPYSGAER